jgi:hypothetical protein
MTSLQNKLARRNREFDEAAYQRLRESSVVNRIREKRTPSEEIARLRKAVACLFDVVLKLHPDIAESDEFSKFKEYHEDVEAITAEVKLAMNVDEEEPAPPAEKSGSGYSDLFFFD